MAINLIAHRKFNNTIPPAKNENPLVDAPRKLTSAYVLAATGLTLLQPAQAAAQQVLTHPLLETGTSILPFLPASLQLPLGALLLFPPATRLALGSAETIRSFLSKIQSFRKFSEGTGRVEGVIALPRDLIVGINSAFSLGASLIDIAAHGETDKPLTATAIELGALALTAYNLHYHKKAEDHLIGVGRPTTPEVWDRALGILGKKNMEVGENDLYKENHSCQYARDVSPRSSIFLTWAQVVPITILAINQCFKRLILIDGIQITLKDFWAHIRGQVVTPSKKFIQEFEMLRTLWAQRIFRITRSTLHIEGSELLKTLSPDQPCLAVATNHTTLFADFAASWLGLPGSRNMADYTNFHGRIIRLTGIPFVLDRAGWLYTGRSKKTGIISNLDGVDSANHLIPLVYVQGGRIPLAMTDEGQADREALFGNVPEPSKPHLYIKRGFAVMAVREAQEKKKPLSLIVVQAEGNQGMAHKQSKFILGPETYTSGHTSRFRIVKIIQVLPESYPSDILDQFEKSSIEASGIVPFLEGRVQEWAQKFGHPEAAEAFKQITAQGKRGLILADRLRCIPPASIIKKSQREFLTQEFIALLAQSKPSEDTLNDLLNRVSAEVRRYQYESLISRLLGLRLRKQKPEAKVAPAEAAA